MAKERGAGRLGLSATSTLRGRIFWSVVPLILVVWVVVSGLSIREHKALVESEFIKRGEAMAANLAYSSELGVFAEDSKLLEASLRGVLKSPDVAYAFIYDGAGNVLASSGDALARSGTVSPALSEEDAARLYEAHESFSENLESNGGRVVDFATPILTKKIRSADELLVGPLGGEEEFQAVGAVRLGLSLQALERHTLDLVQLWGGVTLVLLVVSTLAIYALARRITGPVNRLTNQAMQIAEGVLDQEIPVESRDEIGQLATNFNQMARSLRSNIEQKEQAVAKVQELNRTLEERIRERTGELEQRTAELEEQRLALQQSLTEVRAMGEISRAVSSSLDLEKVLNTIARYAVTLSKVDGCAIFEFNPQQQAVDVIAGYNLSKRFVDQIEATKLQPEAAVIARAFQIPDTSTARQFRFRSISAREGYGSALVVPMGGENSTRGAVLFRREKGRFSYRLVDLLTTLANQSKVAIDNARLFQEVQQREAELERASEHKSQFLANMSHELRTPLNAILGYTELIQDGLYGDVPQKVREAMDRVDYNGRHLLGLINDVLDLSKIEAGQLKLSLGDYSMQDVINTVAASVEPLASEKSLELKALAAPDLPLAYGDERRITQVLLNLVGNAIKFTERGAVTLDVTLSNGAFLVSVSDTGMGIPEDERRKIFEEFHQVDISSTREKGGSGLGLSIARRIVQMHGGEIGVESSLGEGSTFWVKLPVRVEGNENEQADSPGRRSRG